MDSSFGCCLGSLLCFSFCCGSDKQIPKYRQVNLQRRMENNIRENNSVFFRFLLAYLLQGNSKLVFMHLWGWSSPHSKGMGLPAAPQSLTQVKARGWAQLSHHRALSLLIWAIPSYSAHSPACSLLPQWIKFLSVSCKLQNSAWEMGDNPSSPSLAQGFKHLHRWTWSQTSGTTFIVFHSGTWPQDPRCF